MFTPNLCGMCVCIYVICSRRNHNTVWGYLGMYHRLSEPPKKILGRLARVCAILCISCGHMGVLWSLAKCANLKHLRFNGTGMAKGKRYNNDAMIIHICMFGKVHVFYTLKWKYHDSCLVLELFYLAFLRNDMSTLWTL